MRRSTLAAKIKSEKNAESQWILAMWGENVSDTIVKVDWYMGAHKEWEQDKGKCSTLLLVKKRFGEHLCKNLLNAIDTCDSKTFREIADYLDGKYQNTPTKRWNPIDRTRFRIIALRDRLRHDEGKNARVPIKALARIVGFTGDISQLTRLAKELDFPLKNVKTGRPKKTDK